MIGTVFVICATAAAQVGLNAWNRPFYEAVAERNFPALLDQQLVFAVISGCLLVLNVAQAWLREMIKFKSREWLTRDLFAEWVKPGASKRGFRSEVHSNRASFSDSKPFDLPGESISDASLRLDDLWCARVVLQLAAKAENLHIYAAIEHVFVDSSRL